VKYFSLLTKKKFYTTKREPFYELAGDFLPKSKKSFIVDVGCGKGNFITHLNLCDKYKNVFLLDANKNTVKELRAKFKNVFLYFIPNTLPFGNGVVNFLHCSHVIEHLFPNDLYKFLKEVDRVLSDKGILVISSPMLRSEFYSDLSHIKPYNAEVFINYLCSNPSENTSNIISHNYSILGLEYRYGSLNLNEGWGSNIVLFNFLIRCFKGLAYLCGFKKYIRNGYTLILKKKIT
jgi:ubiquinone/menaquinone biosynthesis C-methylase UbiE